MIAGNERRARSSFWLPRAVGAIGAGTIRSMDEVLLSAALAATVVVALFRPATWRSAVWAEQMRVLYDVTVGCLITTVAAGILVGLALVTQGLYWLAETGTTGLVGPVIVFLMIREFTPVLVGLILFGRSGTATLIELSEMRSSGWQRLLELQGLDSLTLLVLPRAFGFALGAFCQGTLLLVTTLTTCYFLAYDLGLITFSIWDFGSRILLAMSVDDFILPALKCIVIGFLVALACCATALGHGRGRDQLSRIVPLGFMRSAFAILMVNILIDMVY